MATLVRISHGDHYFVDSSRAGALADERGRGSKLIVSLRAHALTRTQSLTGLGLDTPAWFARLLKFRRLAIAGEASGHWAEANFYFNECIARLKTRGPEHPAWQWLADEWGRSTGSAALPAAIYRAFIDELFLDLHCGFYNGYLELTEQSRATARLDAHVNYLRSLLDFSHAPSQTWRDVLAPALEDQSERRRNSGDLNGAVSAAEELLSRFPGEIPHADRFARLYFELVVKNLSDGKSESGAQRDSATFGVAISRLEELVTQFPDSLGAFQYVSDLYRLQAIRMANAGDVSESMVAIQKSLAYWPGDKPAEEDAKKIAELIRSTQQRAAQLNAELARSSQLRLNAQGQKIKREAAAGFNPANAFVNSAECKRITEAWERAQLHGLWLTVGLPVPDDHWDAKASKLVAAISQARVMLSEGKSSFPAVWKQVFAVDWDLADLHADKIRRYLLDEPGESATLKSRPAAPHMEVNPNGSMGMEPFWPWLCTPQNPWLKLQALGAVLLVFLSLSLGSYRAVRLHERDAAIKSLERATLAGDSLQQVMACERYFSTSPPPTDPRLERVKTNYRDALARWFAGLPGAPDDNAMQHIHKFAEVSARWQQGGSL